MQSSHFTVGHSDEILPGIFLGSLYSTSPKSLAHHRIQAVLNVAGSHTNANKNNQYKLRDQLIIEIDDLPNAANDMMKKVFPRAFQFLDKYAHPKSQHRTRVLVHCAAGISRSSTVLIAWLMKTFGMPLDDALKLLRQSRPIVNPNHGFMRILREYEHFIRRWKSSRPNTQSIGSIHKIKPTNSGQHRFQSQAAFLTPNSNLKSINDPQALFQSQPQPQFIEDSTPNRWNNELKGMWDRKRFQM